MAPGRVSELLVVPPETFPLNCPDIFISIIVRASKRERVLLLFILSLHFTVNKSRNWNALDFLVMYLYSQIGTLTKVKDPDTSSITAHVVLWKHTAHYCKVLCGGLRSPLYVQIVGHRLFSQLSQARQA